MDGCSGLHSHCEFCVKIWRCSVRPKEGVSCEIGPCELDCGARFHLCKKEEHSLLCANERVPCINAVNGCPVMLQRYKQGRHLERCPASVIHCTMEWNRWPVCSRERQLHVPFHQPNPNSVPGQLDVALALRDQRMLNEWLHAPRRTRRVLRNSLTKRFPPVPLQIRSNTDSPTQEDEERELDDSSRGEVKKNLQRSVYGELYRASKYTTDTLSAALIMITGQNGENGVQKLVELVENKENLDGNRCSGMDIEYVLQEALSGMKVDIDHSDKAASEVMEIAVEPAVITEDENECYDVVFVDHTVVSEISSASMTDHARKQSTPAPPPVPMLVNLGLDLTLESITRYQTKPKSMYTFLCAQEYRRDEYCWHYKNVHSDIHGGLNGWLEQRCPLAHYGCMYSLRRFYPDREGATIVHNDVLESFGIKPFVAYQQDNTQHQLQNGRHSLRISNLLQLPFEILRYVARFLDSFTLCNLALTCKSLREVCSSLLEERGIVVQQWERRRVDGKVSWCVAYKRWFFSTAFSPVERWGFDIRENMSTHLELCPYFRRSVYIEPVLLMGVNPNSSLKAKLLRSIHKYDSAPASGEEGDNLKGVNPNSSLKAKLLRSIHKYDSASASGEEGDNLHDDHKPVPMEEDSPSIDDKLQRNVHINKRKV